MDLLIVWPLADRVQEFVVECKVVREHDGLESVVDEGVEQTARYVDPLCGGGGAPGRDRPAGEPELGGEDLPLYQPFTENCWGCERAVDRLRQTVQDADSGLRTHADDAHTAHSTQHTAHSTQHTALLLVRATGTLPPTGCLSRVNNAHVSTNHPGQPPFPSPRRCRTWEQTTGEPPSRLRSACACDGPVPLTRVPVKM